MSSNADTPNNEDGLGQINEILAKAHAVCDRFDSILRQLPNSYQSLEQIHAKRQADHVLPANDEEFMAGA